MNNNEKTLSIGNLVRLMTKEYGVLFGVLLAQGEILVEGRKSMWYRIGFAKNRHVDLCDFEIEEIIPVVAGERIATIKDIGNKYRIACCDSEGELLDTSMILKNMLQSGKWKSFSGEDKRRFVDNLNIDTDNIIEGLNMLSDLQKIMGQING